MQLTFYKTPSNELLVRPPCKLRRIHRKALGLQKPRDLDILCKCLVAAASGGLAALLLLCLFGLIVGQPS